MRIAVISDIHGNYEALEAVLADIETRAVDTTVNLGDLVSGPLHPEKTADRLIGLGIPTIRGNHERNLLSLDPDSMGASDRFAASRLRADQQEWIAGLPASLVLSESILLCHGTPESDTSYFLETVEKEGCRAASAFEVALRVGPFSASLIVCGHSHIPRVLSLPDGRTILNPGSVGIQAFASEIPYLHKVETRTPHARYAIASFSNRGWSSEFFQVRYDWESAALLANVNDRKDWVMPLRNGRLA
jgi:predicted phosphodiesterase